MRSPTREAVRDMDDRRGLEDFGQSGIVIRENAGRNAALLVHALQPT